MVNYKQALIYYISDGSDVYIGSTTSFSNRKYVHKHRCHNKSSEYYDDKLYDTIRRHGGWDKFEMGILKQYPCETRNELQQYERHLIEKLKPNLNSSLPSTNSNKYKQI